MPKYIYPLTRVMSSIINLGISLIPLFLVSILTGVPFKKSVVLSLYFLWCIIIFSLGLGLFLSTSMVFFRDTQFLWGVLSMIWMYATPIFYPESILPDNFKLILSLSKKYPYLYFGWYFSGTCSLRRMHLNSSTCAGDWIVGFLEEPRSFPSVFVRGCL